MFKEEHYLANQQSVETIECRNVELLHLDNARSLNPLSTHTGIMISLLKSFDASPFNLDLRFSDYNLLRLLRTIILIVFIQI